MMSARVASQGQRESCVHLMWSGFCLQRIIRITGICRPMRFMLRISIFMLGCTSRKKKHNGLRIKMQRIFLKHRYHAADKLEADRPAVTKKPPFSSWWNRRGKRGLCLKRQRDYFTWLSASFTASMMALLVMVALATVSTSALFAATMAAGRASMALSPMPSVSF